MKKQKCTRTVFLLLDKKLVQKTGFSCCFKEKPNLKCNVKKNVGKSIFCGLKLFLVLIFTNQGLGAGSMKPSYDKMCPMYMYSWKIKPIVAVRNNVLGFIVT